jgi:signal transduction histidine kinase
MWPVTSPSNRSWSIGARLAALYALLFAVSTLLLGATSLYLIDAALENQIDGRIAAEVDNLALISKSGSEKALIAAIKQRIGRERALKYQLEDGNGKTLAGDLEVTKPMVGWFDFGLVEAGPEDAPDQFRAFGAKLGGSFLVVAEDTDELENLWRTLVGTYASVGLAAGVLASCGGVWLSRMYLRKLEAFATAARAVTAGDFAQRMPIMQSGDGFDSLSRSLNMMLDRNKELLERQRQITSDIAHDIRTPLTRLRQKLERSQAQKTQEFPSGAIEDTDEILELMTSLLRIAEIEEGARKQNFKTVDLAAIARRVEDIYAPSFEEHGKVLSLAADVQVLVQGDAELLTQLLVNLVENALHHTPRRTEVVLATSVSNGAALLSVSDNGPGIPKGEEHKILERFYRLDRSRTTRGTGLGLNLVKAIADLHGAELAITNLSPGLRVNLIWNV